MAESDKPEGSLAHSDAVVVDSDGSLRVEMESLQKGGDRADRRVAAKLLENR